MKKQRMRPSFDSSLEAIYEAYANVDQEAQAIINAHYEKVKEFVQSMSFEDQDRIFCAVNALCAEQEHVAFLDGVRTGAHLMLELLCE